jgi:hypothetical protein
MKRGDECWVVRLDASSTRQGGFWRDVFPSKELAEKSFGGVKGHTACKAKVVGTVDVDGREIVTDVQLL